MGSGGIRGELDRQWYIAGRAGTAEQTEAEQIRGWTGSGQFQRHEPASFWLLVVTLKSCREQALAQLVTYEWKRIGPHKEAMGVELANDKHAALRLLFTENCQKDNSRLVRRH